MKVADVVLAELEREGASTVRMLERVPADKLDWRPHQKSMSLGQLAFHIAGIPARVMGMLQAGEFDVATAGRAPVVQTDTTAVEVYRRNLDQCRSTIGTMDNEQMKQPFRMRVGERVLTEMPKSAVVRSILLNHTYHHRGQLSVYLRLLDVPVPAMYGTSADEPM
jgi:uncharacterized damage-inducible protein DinB